MRRLTTQRFNSRNRIFPKQIFIGLLALWIVTSIPLSAGFYSYLLSNLRQKIQQQQITQEQLLRDFFVNSSRYGDIVNSKVQIESLAQGFGLKKVWVCRNGIDVIGGATTLNCPKGLRSYTLKMLDQPVEVQFDWSSDTKTESSLLLKAILMTFAASLILFALIASLTYRYFVGKILRLSNKISLADGQGLNIDYEIPELEPIVTSISLLNAKIEQSNRDIANLKTAEALGKLSRQVAHDIRSPLSALRIFSAKMDSSSEFTKLVKTAVGRIEGIAQELLNFDVQKHSRDRFSVTPDFFVKVIQLKVTELQCQIDSDISIGDPFEIALSETSLARALSNVINNSIEAAANHLQFTALIDGSKLIVTIKDNGQGIPVDVISKLGPNIVSTGKQNGHGLGLSYLFQEIRCAGGDVEITSQSGVGTKLSFWLPNYSTHSN